MRRFLIRAGIAALVSLLAGCGSVVKVENAEGYKRAAHSVHFEFRQAAAVPMTVKRYGYRTLPTIDSIDIDTSQREIAAFLSEVRAQSVAAMQAALKTRNIPPGDDATVLVDLKETSHQGYIELTLGVETRFKNAPPNAKEWSFTVKVANDTREKLSVAATKAADTIVQTLVAEGVLVSTPR